LNRQRLSRINSEDPVKNKYSFDGQFSCRKGITMPVVTVEMWEGRTIKQKKQLVKDIAAAFVKMGVAEEHLHIILKDVPKHNWATGSKLASEK